MGFPWILINLNTGICSCPYQISVMKKLVMLHCWLLLTLCIFGHSAGSFAVDDEVDASCVDQETLRGFYEKFSLLEKEKESLRNKLSVCTNGQDVLGLSQSQKDGRELRLLESRIAQLEEENKGLRQRLGADLSKSDGTVSDQNEGKALLKEYEESSNSPVLRTNLEGNVSESHPRSIVKTGYQHSELDPSVQPESSKSQILETAPLQEEGLITNNEEQKKTSNFNALETASGDTEDYSNIQWLDTPYVNNESPFSELRSARTLNTDFNCSDLFRRFERDILPPDLSQSDKQAILELVSSIQSFLMPAENSMGQGGSIHGKDCAVTHNEVSLQKILQDIRNELEGAYSVQEKIQILYQQKIKIETRNRQNL